MLRIKHNNISLHFVLLLILYLCYDLSMSLWLTVAHAAERQEQQPYYVVDVDQTPGVVYRILNGEPRIFYKRRSGNISSIAIWGEGLFFCSADDWRIYQRIGQRERVIFEHKTVVRDIAFDIHGNLFFSEANKAKGDGRIYKLSPHINELGNEGRFYISKEERPIQVRLSTIDKFWNGDFSFDAQGNLYLSTGDRIPAFIYKVTRQEGSRYDPPQEQYRDAKVAIKGIAIVPNRQPDVPQYFIYYSDWRQTIYKLDIRNSRRIVEFYGNVAESRDPHLSDVAFDMRSSE